MKNSKKFYFFIGTTAELIKLIPVIREFKKKKLNFKIITSGQGQVYFDEFASYFGSIKADIVFHQKARESSVFKFIIWTVKTLFLSLFLLRKEFPRQKKGVYFIVHGDTVSSLIGTLIGYFYGLKVVHIESGLRSFNFLEPFPEEVCRFIISIFADIHFCPNEWCVNNLRNHKGVKINTHGNTLIESFWWAIKQKQKLPKAIKGKYFVLVMHRQEHVIFNREKSKKILEFVIKSFDRKLSCVFITHDLTRDFLEGVRLSPKKRLRDMIVSERLPYPGFMHLVSKAEFIVTDGGSNQEEAYYMGKPCLIIRGRTERIEGLNKNAILSKNKKGVILDFFENYKKHRKARIKSKISPSKIIVNYLVNS